MTEPLIPLEQFSLKWRFNDPKYNVLPSEVLERLKPMSEQAARELYERIKPAISNFNINKDHYPNIEGYSTKSDAKETRGWLMRQLSKVGDQEIEISWGPDIAMKASFKDFCNYWDDFCYPGSDDVVILPNSQEWVLYFFHEEQFYLGRRAL